MTSSVLVVIAIALGGWVRTRNRIQHERAWEYQGSSVVPGAEPICLDGHARGVLILHGFGDTTQSVRPLAELLHARGWSVRAPLLRGHGRSLQAFSAARADEWLADARSALRDLQERCRHVTIVGQSMGGALAVILCAEARVDALVLVAPYTRMTARAAAIARVHPLIALVLPYLRSRTERSILDPAARERALGRGVMTPRLLAELATVVGQARHALRRVGVPVLVIHSPQDPRITVADAEAAYAQLGSSTKELRWAARSGHVLTVDYDRDWVADQTVNWLEQHVANA